MIKSTLIDKTGHHISIPNLMEIRYQGYEDVIVLTDFNTFSKADHETYSFIGESRTVNMTGAEIKSVIFDKVD